MRIVALYPPIDYESFSDPRDSNPLGEVRLYAAPDDDELHAVLYSCFRALIEDEQWSRDYSPFDFPERPAEPRVPVTQLNSEGVQKLIARYQADLAAYEATTSLFTLVEKLALCEDVELDSLMALYDKYQEVTDTAKVARLWIYESSN